MILIEDLAYVTLIDEDTKSILTDDANKEIPSNTTMHVAPPGGQTFYFCKWRPLVAEFLTDACNSS